jgi:hypothetical protein
MSAKDEAAIRAVLTMEAERCRAILAADLVALDAMTGEQYIHIETGGSTRDKAGFLQAMARPGHRFVEWVITENNVRLFGKAAVVTGRYHNTVQVGDGAPVTKHARHIRVWVCNDGYWTNVAHQATALPAPPPAG